MRPDPTTERKSFGYFLILECIDTVFTCLFSNFLSRATAARAGSLLQAGPSENCKINKKFSGHRFSVPSLLPSELSVVPTAAAGRHCCSGTEFYSLVLGLEAVLSIHLLAVLAFENMEGNRALKKRASHKYQPILTADFLF